MGIDIAVRAPHQASLADELLWSGHRFRTTVADLDALWARLPKEFQAAEVTVVMEPTRNAWFRWPHGFAAKEPVSCWSPLNDRQTYAPTTPSTPRATGWIPFCWPGFRCCTPKVYTPSAALGQATRYGEPPRCTPPWSNAAPPALPASMRCWRFSARTGMRPFPLT